MQANQEQLHKKNQELVELYREKCKKFTQITNLYNLLKSRAMRSRMQTAASDTVFQTLNSPSSYRNALPPPSTSASNQQHIPTSHPPQTPSSRAYNAYPVDQDGVEQLHRYQRSGTGSSKGAKKKADAAAMPPPSRVGGNARNCKYPEHNPIPLCLHTEYFLKYSKLTNCNASTPNSSASTVTHETVNRSVPLSSRQCIVRAFCRPRC